MSHQDNSEAAAVLKRDGVIIYPTETVYGLGGNAYKETVVGKIFEIKGRRESKPLIVLVKDFSMAEELAETESYKEVLGLYWPGALTGIFRAKRKLPFGVLSREKKVALRISSHPFVANLFKSIDFPLISTSANRSGGKDCLNIKQVKNSLAEKYRLVDLVIDNGILAFSSPSTLVDFTVTPPKVLRQGNVIYSPYAGY